MSGYGKRSLSPEDIEESLAKRQRLGEPDTARDGITHEHANPTSYPTYMTQPQSGYHPQATPAHDIFQPQHVFQPQHIHQPQQVLQPRHGFQAEPVPRPQSILQHQPTSGNNSSSPRPETSTDSGSEDDDEPEEAGPSIPSDAKGKRRASSPAPEEPNAKKGPSARSQKRAGMKNPGRDDRERDEVEDIGGELFWRDPKTGELRKAVYHNDIRAELIAAASAQGAYTHERRRGTRAHDETAFHPEQRDWTAERQHWPRIRDNVLNMHRKANYKGKYFRKAVERTWEHTNGRVILDKDNHPVRKIPDLPATLSSEVEGWYLEVLSRLDNRILRRDVWARLPDGRDRTGSKPASEDMYGLSALGNRRGRWRTSEGLISWKSRGSSKELNDFLRSTISQESLDRNSNEGGRTLTADEYRHAEAIKGRKGNQNDKKKGRKPASKEATTENNVTAFPESRSKPDQALPPGYLDPTSPSLEQQSSPLSAQLAGTETAREDATLEDLLGNTNSGDYYDFSLDPMPGPEQSNQPAERAQQIPGASNADLINNTLGLDGPGSNEPLFDEENLWDGSQQQLWNSLVQANLAAETGNHMRATGHGFQDGWDGNPFDHNGQCGWYQSNNTNATQAALQTHDRMRQQRQGLFDQIDSRAGQDRSAVQPDRFRTPMDQQESSTNGAGNTESLLDMNNNNQSVPRRQLVATGTDLQQTTNPGSEIPQDGGNPVRNGGNHKQTKCSEAVNQFAGGQMKKQTSNGLRGQTAQSDSKANDRASPLHIDLTGEDPDSAARHRLEFLTAMCNSPRLAEADERAMKILNGTAPTSSDTVTPSTAPPQPTSAPNPPPAPNNNTDQPTSTAPTPPSNPVEPHNIIPTTRIHHAILWRLFKPTREAFKAAFRDDAWRPYIARDFVPVVEEPLSYMEILDHYSGEFWSIWTARYGFEVEVPGLVGPSVIDEAAARALRESGERGDGE